MSTSKLIDHDLVAQQEARQLLRNAREASERFAQYRPEEAWRIAEAVGRACEEKAEFYAEWAVREVGFGKIDDKIQKNIIASTGAFERYKSAALGGVRIDQDRNIAEIAAPAGVIVGLSNSTSPVATIIFKSIIALMTRNVIIFSAHPSAKECSLHAARFIAELARASGAPADAVQIVETPSLEGTLALINSPQCDLVLATGGGPMVRAAYSSGNPALGVGPGNVPVYVDKSADLEAAAAQIIEAKNFDYGSACSSPSVVLADSEISARLRALLDAEGAHFCTPGEQEAVTSVAFPSGNLNPKVVAQSPAVIGGLAGLKLERARAIMLQAGSDTDAPAVLKEKLSPLLGYVDVRGLEGAIAFSRRMLRHAGSGHTAGICTKNPAQPIEFGAALPYGRVIVNHQTTLGATGNGNGLPLTFTVGTGYAGKSSVDHNVGPEDLIQWKRVAFPVGEHADGMTSAPADDRYPAPRQSMKADIRDEIQAIVREELASRTGGGAR